jgi:hypothetical protein
MIYRIAFCAALAVLAYYIGREIGRTEPIRARLSAARPRRATTGTVSGENLHGD